MTVQELVTKYAEEHGFDGLVGDGCGCSIENDFAPCGGCIDECGFGYVCPCGTCDEKTKSACHAFSSGEFDFMVLPEKCEKRIELENAKQS